MSKYERMKQNLDEKVEEKDNLPDHSQMFWAIHQVNKQQYENQKTFDKIGNMELTQTHYNR